VSVHFSSAPLLSLPRPAVSTTTVSRHRGESPPRCVGTVVCRHRGLPAPAMRFGTGSVRRRVYGASRAASAHGPDSELDARLLKTASSGTAVIGEPVTRLSQLCTWPRADDGRDSPLGFSAT
jgi:hypothetical protein